MCHARKLELRSALVGLVWISNRSTTICVACTARRELVGQIVLSHDLERLLKHFPELDGLVIRREQVMRSILSPAPLDLVDLLFNFQ